MILIILFSELITSSFLESRVFRFHTGIDISTNGVTGEKILSPFKGEIVRILDKWTGYGRALYLKNKEGFIYVFAHLDKFKEDIEKILYFEKKRLKKNQIDLSLNFEADSGEVIGFSGNSGTFIPHIHLEIRKGFEKPLNPLYFYKIQDTIKPLIEKIKIYPLYKSILHGSFAPCEFKKPFPDTIYITSDFFLWIFAYDYQGKSESRTGIYRLKISIFDSLICDLKFDSIDFDKNYLSRAIYTQGDNSFSGSYIHPVNMENALWKGSSFINFEKEFLLLKIEVYDFNENKEEVRLWIKKDKGNFLKREEEVYFVFDGIVFRDSVEKKIILGPGKYGKLRDFVYVFPLPEKSYKIELKNYEIKIPENFQFFPYPLFFKEKEDTLFIFCAELFFKTPLQIKIKNRDYKEVILKYNEFKKEYEFFSSDSVFYTFSWGKYIRKMDTLEPEIFAEEIYKVNSKEIEIEFFVKDDFSVKNIEFYFRGEWEPVLYNPVTKKAKVKIFRDIKERENVFTILAEDYLKNICEFKGKIIIFEK